MPSYGTARHGTSPCERLATIVVCSHQSPDQSAEEHRQSPELVEDELRHPTPKNSPRSTSVKSSAFDGLSCMGTSDDAEEIINGTEPPWRDSYTDTEHSCSSFEEASCFIGESHSSQQKSRSQTHRYVRRRASRPMTTHEVTLAMTQPEKNMQAHEGRPHTAHWGEGSSQPAPHHFACTDPLADMTRQDFLKPPRMSTTRKQSSGSPLRQGDRTADPATTEAPTDKLPRTSVGRGSLRIRTSFSSLNAAEQQIVSPDQSTNYCLTSSRLGSVWKDQHHRRRALDPACPAHSLHHSAGAIRSQRTDSMTEQLHLSVRGRNADRRLRTSSTVSACAHGSSSSPAVIVEHDRAYGGGSIAQSVLSATALQGRSRLQDARGSSTAPAFLTTCVWSQRSPLLSTASAQYPTRSLASSSSSQTTPHTGSSQSQKSFSWIGSLAPWLKRRAAVNKSEVVAANRVCRISSKGEDGEALREQQRRNPKGPKVVW